MNETTLHEKTLHEETLHAKTPHTKTLMLVLFSSLGGVGLACAAGALHHDASAGTETPASSAAPAVVPPFNPAQSFAPLVEALQPAVVFVSVKQAIPAQELQLPQEMLPFFGPFFQSPDQGETQKYRDGEGSGFIISADGYILTNNHVVENAERVTVKLNDDTSLTAKVVGTDPRTDVGLIKVDAGHPLPYVKLGDSDELKVGDWVVAIGNPLGLSHTVTAGIVSAKGRIIGAGPYDDFIQTDASINPGNSGGPLFDTSGRVVGINTAIAQHGQGIGFAVPVNTVTAILDELKSNGKVARGWIGVGLQKLDKDLAEALGSKLDHGAVVEEVYDGTPGAKAGLERGDIIVSLDGKPVSDSETLIRDVGVHKPGETLKLVVVRQGKEKSLSVHLTERPDEQALANHIYNSEPDKGATDKERTSGSGDAAAKLGITAEYGQTRGESGKVESGLVVTHVDETGPAGDKLEKGDIILEVDHVPVKTEAELGKAIRQSGDLVLLLVEREGRSAFVTIRPSRS
jgi:serine protease Do